MAKSITEQMVDAVKNKNAVSFNKLFESVINQKIGKKLLEKQKQMVNTQLPDQNNDEPDESDPDEKDEKADDGDEKGKMDPKKEPDKK